MTKIKWISDAEKNREWQFVKSILITDKKLAANGTKIRQNNYRVRISHSYLVLDNQILALAPGTFQTTNKLELKFAENEAGVEFALVMSTNQVLTTSHNLRSSLPLPTFVSYKSFGMNLHEYLVANPSMSLPKRLELAIELALTLNGIHEQAKLETKRQYKYNVIKPSNTIIDKEGNVHFIDYYKSWLHNNPDDLKRDIMNLMFLLYTPVAYRSKEHTTWVLGDFAESNTPIYNLLKDSGNLLRNTHIFPTALELAISLKECLTAINNKTNPEYRYK